MRNLSIKTNVGLEKSLFSDYCYSLKKHFSQKQLVTNNYKVIKENATNYPLKKFVRCPFCGSYSRYTIKENSRTKLDCKGCNAVVLNHSLKEIEKLRKANGIQKY